MKQVFVLGGIIGLQAYSTQVVTRSVVAELRRLGWDCQMIWAKPGKGPKNLLLQWVYQAIYRYLLYPLQCRRSVPPGSLVYVTDHANSGACAWLKNACRVVIHVHDLTSIRPPWDFPYPLRLRNLAIWALSYPTKRRGIIAADKIIAISEFTANELHYYLKIPSERITVAHNGIDHETLFPENPSDARKELNIAPDTFVIMTVGPASYRKNTQLLASALTSIRDQATDFRWLHVGALERNTLEQLQRAKLDHVVTIATGIDDAELRKMYSAASVFVSTSLYEGFGLPPLEALTCGTQVVASAIPASQEVLQDLARWFEPDSAEQLAKHLSELSQATPSGKSAASINHAQKFQWKHTAQTVGDILVECQQQGKETGNVFSH